MKKIPREHIFRSIPAFKKSGYDFTQSRCDKHHTDIFQLDFLVKKVICVRGPEAAEMFYDTEFLSFQENST